MKKNIFTIAIAAIAMVLFSAQESEAQIPEGQFGIGASIGAGAGAGQLYYALDANMDLALALGFTNTDNDGNSNSATTAGLQYRYLWTENAIDPYLAANVNFIDAGGPDDGLGVGVAFGAQAQLVKNVFLTAQLGVGYSMYDNDRNVFSFAGSGLGAIIYFDK